MIHLAGFFSACILIQYRFVVNHVQGVWEEHYRSAAFLYNRPQKRRSMDRPIGVSVP